MGLHVSSSMDLLLDLCSYCAMTCWPRGKTGLSGISGFFVSSFAGVDLEGIHVSVLREPDSSGARRLGCEACLSHPSKVAIAAGSAATVAIMLKCQWVPPRLHMNQNSAAQSKTCLKWQEAESGIVSLLVPTQRNGLLCVVLPPPGTRSHDAWGEGFASDLEGSYLTLRHFSLSKSAEQYRGLYWLVTFSCNNSLLWALKLIFFLVACKDSKRAPCSLSQEGSSISG